MYEFGKLQLVPLHMKNNPPFKYSWSTLHKDCKLIASYVKYSIKNDGLELKNIYGIPRGGLVAAVILSHELGLPIIHRKDYIDIHTLVIDDISDSGETFKKLKKMTGMKYSASLLVGPNTKFVPKFWAKTQKKKQWVVFPWETNKNPDR